MERVAADSSSNAARRISNLTTAQAEKKRAIDRDNQRYHRAKNKAYIKSLEQKVLELTGQIREFERLVHHYQQRDIQHENSIASAPPPLTPTTPPTGASSGVEQTDSFMISADLHRQLNGGGCDANLPLAFDNGMTIYPFNANQGMGLINFDITESLESTAPVTPSPSNGQHQASSRSDSISVDWSPPSTSDSHSNTPIWQQVPLHVPPTSKLDEVIQHTTETWRARAAARPSYRQGEFNAPVFPSISSLLNRPEEDERALARSFFDSIAAQVWRSTVKTLAERIGFMYILSHFIRWLVCRSKETYEGMPLFLRPTELQRTVPHPAWVDTIIWPGARDAIISEMDWSRFEEYRTLSGEGLSVSWPYPDSTAIIESPDKQNLLLHPSFEAHILKPENWKISKKVGEAFPFMKPYCMDR